MADRRTNVARSPAAQAEKSRDPLPTDAGGRQVARTVLALVLLLLALWTASDFLPALVWAAILAIAGWPLYVRFSSLLGRRSTVLAPLAFTLLVGLILFVPIGLVMHQVAQQGDGLLAWVTQARDNGVAVPSWVTQLPIAADTVEQWWRSNLTEPQAASAWLGRLNAESALEWVKTLGGQILHRAFMFFVSLLALFVYLRSGRWIAQRAFDTADRIFGHPGERLASKVADAVRGTFNGTILVALTEGLVIGAAYFVAGVPNAALFVVLTIAFAMVPFGAWAAFTAATATLLAGGGSGSVALALWSWGAVVMLIGDHFLWPTFVGGAARLPFLFALIGVFGGLQTFGLLGLFVGPAIMAALLTVWREWLAQPQKQADGA
jgi:predicted PurR-regulated permease PerM